MKKKNNKKKIILMTLSFLIPVLVLTIIFRINGVFKTKTIIESDMYEQYYPLFNYLKQLVSGKNTLFYNFNKSMGGTMFGTFFYYLSSPLNLLIYFIGKSDVINFMTILVITKLSLCGLTMYLFMRKKFKTDNILILMFSIVYSLMGYNINYYINIMWLDVVLMTPLILIGLEKIINNESSKMYFITLFICILSNYYLSYMTCIFLVIYFVYEILQKYDIKKDKKTITKITKKFVITSILSGLMCSFFIIPCIIESKTYGRMEPINSIFTFSMNYFDLISKSYVGALQLQDPLNYSSMNIYCGTITFLLTILYFSNKNITKKEKKLSIIVILMLIMPCFINILNYVWHLFTIPACFSFRYSYLLCIFIIIISYKNITNLNITRKNVYLYLIFYLVTSLYLIIITYYGSYYEFLNYKKIWLTLGFNIINLILLYLYQKRKKLDKLIVIVTIIELTLNFSTIAHEYRFIKIEQIQDKEQMNIENIEKYKNNNYRIKTNMYTTLNDSIFLEYSSPIMFLSTTNYNYLDLFIKQNLKDKDKTNVNMYNTDDIFINMLVGNKTIITTEKLNYELKEEKEYNDTKYQIYNNKYALKLGYMINRNINVEEEKNIDWFNSLYKQLSNSDEDYINILTPIEIEEKEKTYYIDTKEELLILFDKYINTITINDETPKIKYCSEKYCKIENKYYHENIKVKYSYEEELNISLGYKNTENIKKLSKKLQKQQLEIEEKKGNYLKGKINVENDNQMLLITLGYEKGLKIKVDGKETKYKDVIGFIGIDLEKGTHEIEIKYEQPYLKLGIMITIITTITSILYFTCYEKNNIKIEKKH